MSEQFGSSYASAYDLFYSAKDYDHEVALLERTFQTHSTSEVASVVDLGCGTGNHAVRLGARGLQVTGVDRSPAMLAIAKAKAEQGSLDLELIEGDVRELDLSRTFDAAISMFAVLGYQTSNEDVARMLMGVRKHLVTGGLFIFDAWFGPAVLMQGPTARFATFDLDGSTYLRASSGVLDLDAQCCIVSISTWQLDGDRLAGETHEEHPVRYFFPQELRLFLGHAGFELVSLVPFPSGEGEPDGSTWNVMVVAHAV